MPRTWIVIAIVAALLTFGILWLSGSEEPALPEVAEEPVDEVADYWIEGGDMERFGDDGRRLLELRAREMNHYSAREQTTLQEVWLHYQASDILAWDMVADSGKISDATRRVHLDGNVRLLRLPEEGPVMRLTTDWLELLTDEEIARTDAPVLMLQAGSRVTGTGLLALLGEDRISIQHDVKAIHETP